MPVGLFQFETLAVGALDLSGIGLMSAHLNRIQSTIVGVLTMIRTVIYRTLDALIGRAFATTVGIIVHHNEFLLREKFWLSPVVSVCTA